MNMFSEFLPIIVLLLGILVSCQIFTNAIENLGNKLNLSHEFTGSILAAVGTALPETLLPLVAIYMASQSIGDTATKNDIAIGAIVGAPFMLTTLALFLLGLSILTHKKSRAKIFSKKFSAEEAEKRSTKLNASASHLKRDLRFFLLIFTTAILTSFASAQYFPMIDQNLHSSIAITVGVLLILGYLVYLVYTYRASKQEIGDEEDETPELYLCKISFHKLPDNIATVFLQTLIGLLGIIYFAHQFIHGIEHFSQVLNISPLILSLIISPIATELPEKVNSWIWSGEGKDSLAMGNLSGAMVFQSAIPCSIGVLMTPWQADVHVMLCAGITILSALILLLKLELTNRIGYRTLLAIGTLYFVYLLVVFRV